MCIYVINKKKHRPASEDDEGMEDAGFQLTALGAQAVHVFASMRKKQPVFAVREHLALEDQTPFELALTLRQQGYSWAATPSKKADRAALVHVIAGE